MSDDEDVNMDSDEEVFEDNVDDSDENSENSLTLSKLDELEDVESLTERKTKKRKRGKKNTLTKKEIRELQNKEHTYYANLYKVQIEELISEITIPEKRKIEVESWLQNFKSVVMNAQPSESFEISNTKKFLKKSNLPLPAQIHPTKNTKGTCTWLPPTSINVIGSWTAETAINKICEVDVALEVPKTFYNKSDHLNFKYHIKLAIYLSYLTKFISKKQQQLHFTMQNGNPLKPVLVISLQYVKIKIHVLPPTEFFKTSRFTPDSSNLRYEHFFKQLPRQDEPEYATPNYNFTILSDLLTQESQNSIHEVINKSVNFRDAVKILKVWLHQRSLKMGFGGFSGFLTSAFVAYLSSIGKVNGLMSCYEIIRIVFFNLTKLDLTTNGIGFCSDAVISDWHLQFDCVFLDSSGQLNYTSEMSKFTYKRVQFEAQRALAILNGAKVAGFQALLMTPVPFIQNFDHIFQIPDTESLINRLKKLPENDSIILNHSGFWYPVIVPFVGQLIEKCFVERVQLIDCELNKVPEWNITESAPNLSNQPLRFGFIINREAAYKSVEKCNAEDPVQAQTFKDFWGEKSQLRRFKDGTMCETVLFENKKRVPFQMLSYILHKHLDFLLQENGTNYIDCQVESVLEKGYLMIKRLQKPKKPIYIKGKLKKVRLSELQELKDLELDTVANDASTSFDDLSKILRALSGLPLDVSTVQGISSVLRFTNVFPTPPQKFYSSKLLTEVKENNKCLIFQQRTDNEMPPKVPKVIEPILVILHLETSGKWPDDLQAIDHLKCAFLIRIGQLLKDQFDLNVQPHTRHLDVLKDGFVFRIKLTYYRELTLLKQQLGSDGLLRIRDNPESLRLEKESLLLPQLTTTLHSFHRQYEAFGKTCRLAKRWIASQLLLSSPLQYNQNPEQPDCRLSEECIELLVAHLFMYYAPYLSHPNEAQLGFLRFLSLLSFSDWKATAVILNFNEKLSENEISAIELDFVKRRNQLSPLFIATPEDKTASVWTKNLEPIILQRAQLLATQAMSVLKDCLDNHTLVSNDELTKQVKKMFRPATEEFDVIIHLKKEMNARAFQDIDAINIPKFKKYIKSPDELIPIVDFDPVQMYLRELRDAFGHVALFLHNNYGGKYIAVVWRPEVFNEHDFSISSVNCQSLNSCGKLSTNIDGIVESFELLGRGIVERIEKKWEEPMECT